MINLIKIEMMKLRTTPAFYATALAALVLSLGSAITNVLITPGQGDPPRGSAANAQDVLSQAGSVGSQAIFILGILVVAGEYRHRTIMGAFLAEPRRLRVIIAKMAMMGGVGAVLGAVIYTITTASAVSLYSTKGVHHLPVNLVSLGLGTVVSGACYGLLGVAVGALARNTVAAVIGGIVWIQVLEVAVLENAAPSFAKWLPVGAARGLTSIGSSLDVLSRPTSAAVLVAWAAGLVLLAAVLSTRRELR
jgi:ABC-type transport system involved in multi-copper enzyme maturation permease subunit